MGVTVRELLSASDADAIGGEIPLELCWKALEGTTFGRLAVATDRGVDIFPINYAVDGTKIYFRTAPGSKLDDLVQHPHLALEIDALEEGGAYSVVVKGRAEVLEAPSEIDAAAALPLTPWVPSLKLRWVRIRPSEVTGRVYRRGIEPPPYV